MTLGRRFRTTLGPSLLLAASMVFTVTAAQAQTLAPPGGGFDLPLDCRMGEVCSVQNYIDHDPGPGWRDHTCGGLSYDGHRGIDIRVPTQIEMRQGVAVVAAAAGEVIIAEDGQPDLLMQDTGPGKTREQRNGNWVAIKHGGTWVTTYAHMMKGSVAVKAGDRVERGQKLGLIGLSGNSDFPHVHFAVTHRNKLLDPFTGTTPEDACGTATESLWSPAAAVQLAYRVGGLLSAGLLGRQPSHREIMDGIEAPNRIEAEAPVLIFWIGAWGLRKGDRQILTILDPKGKVFLSKDHILERDRATVSRWIGRKLRAKAWPAGTYRGLYRVERRVGGTTVTVIETQREVEIR
ncbi:MAG: M23 family metallopeptidase [Kiloniellaceae bacterium]